MICMTVGRPGNRKRPAVGAWNQINESMHQTSWTLLHLNASHAFHECHVSSKHNRTSRVRGGQRASASRVRSSKHKERIRNSERDLQVCCLKIRKPSAFHFVFLKVLPCFVDTFTASCSSLQIYCKTFDSQGWNLASRGRCLA